MFATALVASAAVAGCGQTTRDTADSTARATRTPVATSSSDARSSATRDTTQSAPTRRRIRKTRLVACDPNIRVNAWTTTCAFAQNAFYEFWAASAAGDASEIVAYSEASARWLKLKCKAERIVRCTADDGSDIRLSELALDGYTTAQASAYASSHRVSAKRLGQNDTKSSRVAESRKSERTARAGAPTKKVCIPETRLPAVHSPSVHLPAVTLPAFTDFQGKTHPARRIPGRRIPARTIPGRTIGGQCFEVTSEFGPRHTSILSDGYERVDPDFSADLTESYWNEAGKASMIPDYTATGFGEANAAGFPKNQYVRPYVRRDGTHVSGYWRNSPTDGLPTCRVISC